ncbi:MAG: hypothetical protein ACR2MO_08245 [Acidimicrobiales bacterium]
MLSDRSRLQWDTFLAARRAHATPFGDRDELHRFIIGVHLRGEQVTAPDMGELLDKAGAGVSERETVGSFVENGLALLASYERIVAFEDGAYADSDGVFEV